ncbi:MAG: DUF3089 domain-containing protein [Butyrivibrio sp.]|nr:DUF3089 domain-containing protein [Butyrivibrio sp.]
MNGNSRKRARANELRRFREEQRTDVYAALDYCFENYNQGRPFILAGHSQGSMMIKIALQDYFLEHDDYLKRMVAAYVLGYSITADDLKANPALKFAEGADDTGVIVSWNIEGPENKHESNITVMNNSIAINPLNWKRDETYAPATENKGDRLPVPKEGEFIASEYEPHRPGIADAQLDVERGLTIFAQFIFCRIVERKIQVKALMMANIRYHYAHDHGRNTAYQRLWRGRKDDNRQLRYLCIYGRQ